MPIFATFDQGSYYGGCPNVARTPPSSPGFGAMGLGLKADCSCQDSSFGGVIDLQPVDDDAEPFPKARVTWRGWRVASGAQRMRDAVMRIRR